VVGSGTEGPKLTKRIRSLYSGPVLIAPSILSANFGHLEDEIKSLEVSGVDLIHIDIMDGHFVPNLTFGPMIVKTIRKYTSLPLTCHLMVTEPERWISPFSEAGADLLTIHCEATRQLRGALEQIKGTGCECGVALNPASPLVLIEEVLEMVDLVLVMSVEPGFGGQEFIPTAYQKIERLAAMRTTNQFLIGVDGGVNSANVKQLRKAGADVLVAGSAIFNHPNHSRAVEELRENAV
jgi:ribulose-phosphate 3-epimerase